MFRIKTCLLTVMAIMVMSSAAFAVTIIPYQDEWNYVVVSQLKPLSNWQNVNYDDVDWDNLIWKTDKAGFSNSLSAHPVNRQRPNNNKWPVNTFLLLEKTITYDHLVGLMGEDEQVSSLFIKGYVDNAVAVFINGHKIGYNYAGGQFTFAMAVSDARLDGIWNHDGDNVFQIIAMDHGGSTYFDMQVTTHPTPIPASALLMGSGLLGLLGVRKRTNYK